MTLQDEIKTAMSSVGLALSDDMLSRCELLSCLVCPQNPASSCVLLPVLAIPPAILLRVIFDVRLVRMSRAPDHLLENTS